MDLHKSVHGALPWGPGAASRSFIFPMTHAEPPLGALGLAGGEEADGSGSDQGVQGATAFLCRSEPLGAAWMSPPKRGVCSHSGGALRHDVPGL